MTFGELKTSLNYLLAGDSAMRRDDGALKTLYKKAVFAVAHQTEPLSLITADIEHFEQLRPLDGAYFIRIPEIPATDESALDIDDGLTDAVLNLMAGYMTASDEKRQLYDTAAAVAMDGYIAESLSYLQNTGYGDAYGLPGSTAASTRSDIPKRLDKAGLLKFFRPYPTPSADKWKYEWDETATAKLDKFLLDGDGRKLSVSEIKLWEQYSNWADTGVDAESEALKTLDREYLKRII